MSRANLFRMRFVVLSLALLLVPLVTVAQETRTPSHCIALANNIEGATYLHKASYNVQVVPETVRIHYIAHISFLIRTAGGLNIITDFTQGSRGPHP